MINIAIIGTRGYPYIYSGYETFVKELGERLVKKGLSVTVYCHRNLFPERPATVNGIKLVYVPSVKNKNLSQFIHSFQSFFHAVFQKHDMLLVVNSANGPFGIIARIFQKKTVINVDGLEWKRPKWRGLGAKYFYLASKLSIKLYDQVITDSVEMQKIYRREFDADSKVIAYGANIRYSKRPELIGKWNLKSNDYFLIVGRLVPDNNAKLIIGEFLKSHSSRRLVVVGDVPYRDSYARDLMGINDPRVVFTGYVRDQNELAELYHNCFVYFHGHEFGGTNPAMLKALAYGSAVCALDTVFNREMLVNEDYGVFFSKEPGHLANKISVLEKSAPVVEELKAKSRDRIKENYTWEKITAQYLNLIQLMTGKKP